MRGHISERLQQSNEPMSAPLDVFSFVSRQWHSSGR